MSDEVPGGLPRPPRRVPPGAENGVPHTVIEARQAGARKTARPPRAWYLLPVMILVVAAGAGGGWAVHERGGVVDTNKLDLDDISKNVGPAVVRVHGSVCEGTGAGTGILIDKDRVLTPASAIRHWVSVAVETADGRVRPAQVDGVDASGIAELRLLGDPLDVEPVEVAAQTPSDGLDVAVIGYDGGTQTADPHAIVQPSAGADLTGVSGLLPSSAVGSAVLDRGGHAIGMVTAADPSGARAVGLSVLRGIVDRTSQPTAEPKGCREPKGPQGPVVPELAGPSGKLAEDAQRTLGEFLTAINRHDEQAVYDLMTGEQRDRSSIEAMEEQYRTEYDFQPKILSVRRDGDGAQVEWTFTSLQAPKPKIPHPCVRYDLVYYLKPADGQLRIEGVKSAREGDPAWRPCTSD